MSIGQSLMFAAILVSSLAGCSLSQDSATGSGSTLGRFIKNASGVVLNLRNQAAATIDLTKKGIETTKTVIKNVQDGVKDVAEGFEKIGEGKAKVVNAFGGESSSKSSLSSSSSSR